MAWNGSDSGVGNSTQSARDAKNAKAGAVGHAGRVTLPGGGRGAPALPKWWRGAAALAIVVVGGALAWWWVAGRRTHVPDVPEVAHVPSLKGQKTNDKRQTKAVALKCDPPDAIATSVAIPPIADV